MPEEATPPSRPTTLPPGLRRLLLEPPWSTVLDQLSQLLPPGELVKFALSQPTLAKPSANSQPGENGEPPRPAPYAQTSDDTRQQMKDVIDSYARSVTSAREQLLAAGARLQTETPDITGDDVRRMPAAEIDELLNVVSAIAATWAPPTFAGAPIDVSASLAVLQNMLRTATASAERGDYPPPGI